MLTDPADIEPDPHGRPREIFRLDALAPASATEAGRPVAGNAPTMIETDVIHASSAYTTSDRPATIAAMVATRIVPFPAIAPFLAAPITTAKTSQLRDSEAEMLLPLVHPAINQNTTTATATLTGVATAIRTSDLASAAALPTTVATEEGEIGVAMV